jgi:hypothetical protein
MKKKPCSVELALYNALRYEESTLKNVVDYQQRWNISDSDRKIILNWISSRMKEITDRL